MSDQAARLPDARPDGVASIESSFALGEVKRSHALPVK
jgi:hypothetical protein